MGELPVHPVVERLERRRRPDEPCLRPRPQPVRLQLRLGCGRLRPASPSRAVGTETDGSIVCPSGANGIVGIDPTLGLLSGGGHHPDLIRAGHRGADGAQRDRCSRAPRRDGLATPEPITARFLDADALEGKVRSACGATARATSRRARSSTRTWRPSWTATVDALETGGCHGGRGEVDVAIEDAYDPGIRSYCCASSRPDLPAYFATYTGRGMPEDAAGRHRLQRGQPGTRGPVGVGEIFELAEATNGRDGAACASHTRRGSGDGDRRDRPHRGAGGAGVDAIIAPTNKPPG